MKHKTHSVTTPIFVYFTDRNEYKKFDKPSDIPSGVNFRIVKDFKENQTMSQATTTTTETSSVEAPEVPNYAARSAIGALMVLTAIAGFALLYYFYESIITMLFPFVFVLVCIAACFGLGWKGSALTWRSTVAANAAKIKKEVKVAAANVVTAATS